MEKFENEVYDHVSLSPYRRTELLAMLERVAARLKRLPTKRVEEN